LKISNCPSCGKLNQSKGGLLRCSCGRSWGTRKWETERHVPTPREIHEHEGDREFMDAREYRAFPLDVLFK